MNPPDSNEPPPPAKTTLGSLPPDALAVGKRAARFGELVRLLREQLELTQAELAKKAGLSQAVISKIEAAATVSTAGRAKTLAKLARALRVTDEMLTHWNEVRFLFRNDDDPQGTAMVFWIEGDQPIFKKDIPTIVAMHAARTAWAEEKLAEAAKAPDPEHPQVAALARDLQARGLAPEAAEKVARFSVEFEASGVIEARIDDAMKEAFIRGSVEQGLPYTLPDAAAAKAFLYENVDANRWELPPCDDVDLELALQFLLDAHAVARRQRFERRSTTLIVLLACIAAARRSRGLSPF